jgi:thymidine kinase
MAKLFFNYSTMNAGKSAILLSAANNYEERGMRVLLLTATIDDRAGTNVIASRMGTSKPALGFSDGDDLFALVATRLAREDIRCVLVDESQFLTEEQVWQLARVVDGLDIPVMCFGLRTDFQGKAFPGSAVLLALADEMDEVRTICHCGKKATMVVRRGSDGKVVTEGDQVAIGGNDRYETLCRRHWGEATGRVLKGAISN